MNAAANTFLAELGRHLGMPGLEFDSGGLCTIGLDEHIINFEHAENGAAITVCIWLGTVPAERRAEAAQQIADANFLFRQTDGATIGLDRETGDAALALRIHLPETTFAQFEQIVENLVNLAEGWRNALAQSPVGAEADGAPAAFVPARLRA